MVDGEPWHRCPRRPVKDDPETWSALIEYFNWREKGFLPFPGSYSQQPNLLVQSWKAIDAAMRECDEAEKSKSDRQRKANEAAKRGAQF